MATKSLAQMSRSEASPKKSSAQMAWFTELAGKAENLLNNLDEKTASVLQKSPKTEVFHAETQPWLRQSDRLFTKITRKCPTETQSNYSPNRKNKPNRPIVKHTDSSKESPKSALRKSVKKGHVYTQNFSPHTMVIDDKLKLIDDEIVVHDFGPSFRRKSLPNGRDLEIHSRTNRMETLNNENDMLKNEISVCNQEISDFLDKMRALEEDMKEMEAKHENLVRLHANTVAEKESLSSELECARRASAECSPSPSPDYPDLQSAYRALEQQLADTADTNRQLQDQVKKMEMSKVSNSSIQMKVENELHFAQAATRELRAELESARAECGRVQADWDAYKLRVKSMLLSKDKEIQAMRTSPDVTDGTNILLEELEALREERSQLSCAEERARGECAAGGRRAERAEARALAAERLVAALREALREERLARNRADNQCILNNKELKSLQMETSQQIATLSSALRDKEGELYELRASHMRSATSMCPATDASALNVAERERAHDTYSSEKVQLLTQSLIAKQGRIDLLLAENNTLKLHIESVEGKHRQELSNLRNNQSVIQVTDGDALLKARVASRSYIPVSILSKVSLQIGVYMRRHPLFRFFIIMYMVCLHIWVSVVLLTYSPEVHSP